MDLVPNNSIRVVPLRPKLALLNCTLIRPKRKMTISAGPLYDCISQQRYRQARDRLPMHNRCAGLLGVAAAGSRKIAILESGYFAIRSLQCRPADWSGVGLHHSIE